jgi:hypothetical protein
MRILASALVLLVSSTATAEPRAEADVQQETVLALAANQPFTWVDATSIALSAYVGFAKHHAVRANIATHVPGISHGVGTLIGDVFFDGDGSEASYSGRSTDVGISYQFYPRALFSGLFVEAGVMRRSFDEQLDDYYNELTRTTTGSAYAGRVHLGWSWALGQHGFVAAAVGVAAGRYVGIEVQEDDYGYTGEPMTTTTSFNEVRISGEAYLRFGARFGL